ncbi:hypothetical protein RIF29_32098 [Crotalaria pallida]|uniref:ubiquitinyl hydrolase 1 n=1 Tax=Crotalaria pallida TaxID=3830 RepID=A0AAN9EHS6_CROPI
MVPIGLGLQQDEAECCDVYGLDEQLLEMVPKPVSVVLFLYPLTAQANPNRRIGGRSLLVRWWRWLAMVVVMGVGAREFDDDGGWRRSWALVRWWLRISDEVVVDSQFSFTPLSSGNSYSLLLFKD